MVNLKLCKAMTIFIGVSGCFSVLFGAWLAHAGVYLAPESINRLETAHHYQVIHTLALMITLVWYQQNQAKALMVSLVLFVSGILFFSGSLYLKTLLNWPSVGALAPFGGISLALAWFTLVFVGKKT